MKIDVVRLHENAILPTRGSSGAAAFDLYACLESDIAIAPGYSRLIRTGFSFAIPEGYFGGLYARSGLSVKHGMRPSNCVGVIDEDYRGEVQVSLYNDGQQQFVLRHGERIAQLIIQKYEDIELVEVDELPQTIRGSGGFGSTG